MALRGAVHFHFTSYMPECGRDCFVGVADECCQITVVVVDVVI